MPIRRPRRAARRRVGAVGTVAVALGLLLTGCVGTPAPTPTPTPREESTAAPIFASDEEALAAAEAAYERFIDTTTMITNNGGATSEELESVATGSALDEESDAAKRFREEGLRTIGTVTFRVHKLQSVAQDADARTLITLYVCDDLREVDLLDAAGESMVVEGRVVDVPYIVVVTATDANNSRVSEKELWTRDNFCLA